MPVPMPSETPGDAFDIAPDQNQKESAGAPALILASASPRRQELIALLGLPFTVRASRYQEPPAPGEPIDLADFVMTLAREKAREVAGRVAPERGNRFVIGADTLVTLATGPVGLALGKPVDHADARRMLTALSGTTHVVHTGVAVLETRQGRITRTAQTSVATQVRFRALSETMIADYIATGEPLDKAGAYGAQGYAAPFIEGYVGDFFNVVGLPLCALGQLLEQCGLEWWHYRNQMPALSG